MPRKKWRPKEVGHEATVHATPEQEICRRLRPRIDGYDKASGKVEFADVTIGKRFPACFTPRSCAPLCSRPYKAPGCSWPNRFRCEGRHDLQDPDMAAFRSPRRWTDGVHLAQLSQPDVGKFLTKGTGGTRPLGHGRSGGRGRRRERGNRRGASADRRGIECCFCAGPHRGHEAGRAVIIRNHAEQRAAG